MLASDRSGYPHTHIAQEQDMSCIKHGYISHICPMCDIELVEAHEHRVEYEVEAFIAGAWRDWQTLETGGDIQFFMDRRKERYPNWEWRYRQAPSFERAASDWSTT
jgi:Zn-finger nucleic acid-binding protein